MKIRRGFVSNSSSSSYVVFIPDKFDIEKIEINEENLDEYETTKEKVIQAYNRLINEGEVWAEESGYGAVDVLEIILKDFIVGQYSSGPESEKIVMVDKEKIKELMKG